MLKKDIENLEIERTALKQRLLDQAIDRGERAVELGLTSSETTPDDVNTC